MSKPCILFPPIHLQEISLPSTVLHINLLTKSCPQSTTTGLCSGPPSNPPSGSSAPAFPPCVLSSAAYRPSPSSVPSAARSVYTPCALPKVLPKVLPKAPAIRRVTPETRASRAKGLSTLKECRALAPSTITSQLWNWRTGIECVIHGMARETVSISIRKSVSALRIWCDGSGGLLRCSCAETMNTYLRKGFQWSCSCEGRRALTLGEEQCQWSKS